jgi:imidazoleglycerol-phosphate dehydratase/histidinol-phosphatase
VSATPVIARQAEVTRETRETRVQVRIDLDTTSPVRAETGIRFFDHMLEQLATHGGFALDLTAKGDLDVDEHHTVEDCALAIGEAFKNALGAKHGIARYGFLLPMDESLAQIAIDLSGRPYVVFSGTFPRDAVGGLPTELVPHFFRSFSQSLGAAIHVSVTGENTHHMIEACFKGVGRSLRQAIRREGSELPSTKGVL